MESRADLLMKALEVLRTVVSLIESELGIGGQDDDQMDLPGLDVAMDGSAKEPATFDEVQRVLVEKSRDGFKNEVKTMLSKHGATKLSDIKDGVALRSLLDDAEEYCREITTDEIRKAADHVIASSSEKHLKELLEYYYAASVDELPKSGYAGFLWEARRV